MRQYSSPRLSLPWIVINPTERRLAGLRSIEVALVHPLLMYVLKPARSRGSVSEGSNESFLTCERWPASLFELYVQRRYRVTRVI